MKYLVLCGFVLLLFVRSTAAQTERTTNPPQPQGQQGWVQVPVDTNLYVAVCFISKDTCYAVNAASYYRSEDGGSTWHRIAWPIILSSGMSFVNSRLGYIAGGSNHTAYHTSDGGQTWDSADDQAQLVQVVLAISKDTAFVTGDGFLSRTTDAGKTWVAVNPQVVALALAFADSKHGVAVGEQEFGPMAGQYGGGCATTSDGGATWVQQYTGATSDLEGCTFSGTDTINAAGGLGLIYRSTDAGATWRSVDSGSTHEFYAISSHRSNILAVGENGTIRASSNSGETWYSQTSGIHTLLGSIKMFDDSLALAAGEKGVILKTTNGGTDWVQVSPPSPQQLSIGIYPEPETPTMDIFYDLPQLQDVTVTVYDMLGKRVAHLLENKLQTAGRHSVQIKGGSLPAGSYVVRIQTERFSGTGKFEIMK